MATDTSAMMENLLIAINIIAEKKVESLPYDKTLTCTIVNADNAAKGEYSVTDGTSTFLAYSDNTTYKVNTRIYVTVPNGDFNNKKIIKGKYISGEEEPYYTYVSPLDNFLDITGNIYGYNDDNAITNKIGLTANATTDSTHTERILLWSLGYTETTPTVGKYEEKLTELNLNQYTRLGIGGSFSTRLSGVITGHYGLSLEVITEIPQSDAMAADISITEILNGEYTLTEALQQTVIDKAQELAGSSQSISGYASALEYLSGLPNSITIATRGRTKYRKYKYELDSQNMFGNPYRFIIPSNQEVLFDISNIKNEPIVGLQMYFYEIPYSFRTMDGSLFPVAQYSNLFVQDIIVSFGYDTKEYSNDTVLCYTTAPLVYLSTSRTIEDINSLQLNKKKVQTRWIHKQDSGRMYAIDQADEIPTYQINDTESIKMATIHWYQYQLDNPYAGDEIAGPQWAEIEEWQDQFAVDFIPDYKKASEHLKVIVEYPSVGYVNNMLNSSEELSRINGTIVNTQTEKQQLELSLARLKMEDPNNSTRISELEEEIKQKEYSIDLAIRQYDKKYADIQASIATQYYESEILVFSNESEVANQINTDLVQGLAVECDVEDRKGEYYCYQQNTNQIINRGDAVKLRYLRARYNSILTFSDLDVPEIISWYIPLENTMIAIPKEGVTYNQKDSEGNNLDSTLVSAEKIIDNQSLYRGYFKITRRGSKITEQNTHSDTYIQAAAEQPFQIKDIYSATAKNNRIYCEVIRNNISYWGHVDLLFDYGSLQGTKYTFVLSPTNGEALTVEVQQTEEGAKVINKDSLTLRPFIYDYNHNDITDTLIDKITYSWYVQSPADGATTSISETRIRGNVEDDGYLTLNVNPTFSNTVIQNLFYYIVQAKVTSNFGSIDGNDKPITLIARYPVAIKRYISSTEEYGNFFGNSLISYSNQGVNPIYYKDAFSLKKISQKIESCDTFWKVAVYDKFPGDTQSQTHFNYKSPYYPQFSSKNCLIVPNIFMSNSSKRVSAVCFDSYNNIIWIQPLIIEQYGYESEMLNVWDGSLTIDENNDTILSAMIGAGIKTPDNKFSGVLMGQISKAELGNPDIGLYGYHEGSQSFGFKVDGTAFLGKSGKGQINFDGNKGIITTPNFNQKNQSNEDIGSGMHIDLDDGILQIKNKGKLKIKMQPSFNKNDEGYFMVNGQNEVRLINIGNDAYYLQTSNYNTANHTGTKIDLANGRIQSYNFTILAYGTGNNSNNWIQIQSSHGTTPLAIGGETSADKAKFHVNWDGTLYATGADIQGTLHLNSNSEFDKSYLKNLNEGKIAGWTIYSQNNVEAALVHSSGNTVTHYLGTGLPNGTVTGYTYAANNPLVFKAGSNFGVTNDGTLYATGAKISGNITSDTGNIGSWTINGNFLAHYSSTKEGWITHYLGNPNILDVSVNGHRTKDWVFLAGNDSGFNFGVTKDGNLYAANADIGGKITAGSGSIGGWIINTDGLRYGGTDAIPTIYVGSPKTINNVPTEIDWNKNGTIDSYDTNWASVVLKAGDAFFVQSNGALWANNAHINGTVNATSGTFDNVTINSNSTFKGNLSAASGTFGGTVSGGTISGGSIIMGGYTFTGGKTTTIPTLNSDHYLVYSDSELTATCIGATWVYGLEVTTDTFTDRTGSEVTVVTDVSWGSGTPKISVGGYGTISVGSKSINYIGYES